MKHTYIALAMPALAGLAAAGGSDSSDPLPWTTIVAEGDVTAKIFGRLNLDGTWLTGGDDGLYDTDDGVEFRRARMGVTGTIYDLLDYKFEVDFVEGAATLKDVYLEPLECDLRLRVGHFKEPVSLEELTSARFTTFIERGLPNALVPSRNVGIQVGGGGEPIGWAAGIFRDTDDFAIDNEDDEPDSERDAEYAYTGRVYGVPVYTEEGLKVVHIGFSYSLREPDDQLVRFRSRPEAHLPNYVVDTGSLPADSVSLGGLEFAWVGGPLSAQAEYNLASVDALSGGMDADYSGYYAELSYFLTGEHRVYKPTAGAFDRVKPNRNVTKGSLSGGAWQLAARYSFLDLDDGATEDEMTDITVGATWILNPNTKVMFNVIQSEAESGPVEDDALIGLVRLQVDW